MDFETNRTPATVAYVVLVLAALLAQPTAVVCADSHTVRGRIIDASGSPVAGAMVTFASPARLRTITIYSQTDGSFNSQLNDEMYNLAVRRTGFKDLTRSDLKLTADLWLPDLKLTAETEPKELSSQLPANRWMPLVLTRLSSDARRDEFIRQCGYCHQQGSWATRSRRSLQDWQNIFDEMAGMGGRISPELRAELPGAFNGAFTERNYVKALTEPEFVAPPLPQGAAATATITEWTMGTSSSMLHDIAVGKDGVVWALDLNNDMLYRLDPGSNERRQFPIPTSNLPVGGFFRSSGLLQGPGVAARVGPHSLQIAADGTIWITLCLGNQIAHFDPRTAQWKIFTQEDGLYPHTLRIDRKGRVWYTLAVSNQIGMIDPSTGEMRAYHLPALSYGQAATLRVLPWAIWAANYLGYQLPVPKTGQPGPVPYGIDIAPDGGVWFSQVNARRIGRLDPDSGEVKIVETPFPGPRRLRFDSQGNLWIPGFSAGLIARYSPGKGEFKTFPLPTGGIDTPYALNVDRRTDTVWICGTASDTLMSFDPRSERFTVYPFPVHATFTREIDFDKDGGIWTSNSSFPASHIQSGGETIIRIQPGPAS
jgi:virginiamycin B lyase